MIIPRYILREFLLSTCAGVVVFTFVLLLEKLFEIVSLVLSRGVGFLDFMSLLAMLVVPLCSVTIPMAFLLASLLTFGRLSEHGEIMALRASGWSFVSILWPTLLAGLVAAGLMLPLNHRITPRFQHEFRSSLQDILQKSLVSNLEEKTFLTLGEYRLFIKKINKKSHALQNVFIFKNETNNPTLQIHAKAGRIARQSNNAITLELDEGTMQRQDADDPRKIFLTHFKSYCLTLPLSNSRATEDAKSLREINTKEIKGLLKDSAGSDHARNELLAELAKRTALAFAPFFVLLIGLPLGIVVERGGRGIGFGLTLGIIVFYYSLLILGITWAENGGLNPTLALWIPNTTMALIGFFFLKRLLRK